MLSTPKRFVKVAAWLAVGLFVGTSERPANAGDRIVTWNVREIFTPLDAERRTADLEAAADALSPDILLIQEVASCDAAGAVRNLMGLRDFHLACSDFDKDGGQHSAFEVAIISRYPLEDVVEFDPSPDGRGTNKEEPLRQVAGVPPVGVARGFLRARVPALNLAVSVVHLKSSQGAGGKEDRKNASQREYVAGAVAADAARHAVSWPDHAYVVAGDFNVGHSDRRKNGTSLASDCYADCSGKDPYDETHALLGGGLVEGLRMRNLAAGIKDSTYPSFPGSPIDNIYVLDPQKRFSAASKAPKTFGSDHLAVWAEIAGKPPAAPSLGVMSAVATLPKALAPSDGYYSKVDTSNPAAIRATLHQTIAKARRLSYAEVWEALAYTDADPASVGHVRLIYSGTTVPVEHWERPGTTASQDEVWNREHVWPKSKGFPNQGQAAHTDIHHLRAADKNVNSTRGNKDFDEGGQAVPQAPGARHDSDSFEPPDADKGAVSRMIMYMVVRYEGDGATGNLELSRSVTKSGQPSVGRLCTLLAWHRKFPVDDFERRRNDRVQEVQGNRNPFVDHPDWAEAIWGGAC